VKTYLNIYLIYYFPIFNFENDLNVIQLLLNIYVIIFLVKK